MSLLLLFRSKIAAPTTSSVAGSAPAGTYRIRRPPPTPWVQREKDQPAPSPQARQAALRAAAMARLAADEETRAQAKQEQEQINGRKFLAGAGVSSPFGQIRSA